ncbi:MAG: hypothetical protein ACRD21_27275 [Vicinamibacteria bacterium]
MRVYPPQRGLVLRMEVWGGIPESGRGSSSLSFTHDFTRAGVKQDAAGVDSGRAAIE